MAPKKPLGGKNTPLRPTQAFDLQLPDFSDQYLDSLHVCSHFTSAVCEERFEGDARFGNKFWLHIIAESEKAADAEGVHLHFDIVKTFGKRKRPPATHEISEILSEVSPFEGHSGSAWVAVEYVVPVESLPRRGVIEAFLGLATKSGGVSLAFSGATMKIEDESLDELSWKLTDDRKHVKVGIEMLVETTVSRSFLIDLEKTCRGSLNRLVLDGDRQNG